jgi:HEAT repeat protein
MIPSVIQGFPRVADMFEDSIWYIRREAVEAFGQVAQRSQKLMLGSQETIDPHIKALQDMMQNAIPRLLSVLKDDDDDVIEAAVKVFGELTEYGSLSVDFLVND